MAATVDDAPNGFVRVARKVYHPLGFTKGYNFTLFFLACGYIFAFSLSRVQYFNFSGIFCRPGPASQTHASPGECFYYNMPIEKIGIQLHLYCILPAGLLVVLQFVPAIRYHLILLHRINGYLVITLSLLSSAGVLMFARHAFGGDLATQAWSGAAIIATTGAYLMAYINIKLLQIDQHRAWMIRAWGYFSQIATIRIIMIISAQVVTAVADYYTARPCAQVASAIGQKSTTTLYPGCVAAFNGTDPNALAIVQANFKGNAMEISASLGVSFGMAGWVAFMLHAFAIEIYLALTPRETARLKLVSYERQLERGWKYPGSMGLTAERLGDAEPYVPPVVKMPSESFEAKSS